MTGGEGRGGAGRKEADGSLVQRRNFPISRFHAPNSPAFFLSRSRGHLPLLLWLPVTTVLLRLPLRLLMLLLLASVSPEPPQRGQSADAISCTALCKQTLNIRRFTVEDNSQQASEAKIGGKIRINEIFIHILLRYSSTVSLFMGGGGDF